MEDLLVQAPEPLVDNLDSVQNNIYICHRRMDGVQMPGISGSFEVLDRHAPLVSALKAGRVKVLRDQQNHTAAYQIQSGFEEVLNNKVTVLVEGATIIE